MSEELNKDMQAEPGEEIKEEIEKDADLEKEPQEDAAEEVSESEAEEGEAEETSEEESTDGEAAGEETAGEKAGEKTAGGTKTEKKAAKKKFKIDKKQEALKEKIEELEDKVKRQMAEFDNFRKRTEKEKSAMFEMGAKSVIEKILPVVDNFERGLSAIPEEQKGDAFAEGMEMIYKQLLSELEKMEVKPIPAVGEEFDPNFHNAVMQVESEEYESGVIAQELQKGYTYRDSVVRHSMVAVVS
ncbi:MAG: nucleotide exchange factor GrpE [Clostridium sp.]|nr:nucleotide exchange factor GrpE [Clostridium sp.]